MLSDGGGWHVFISGHRLLALLIVSGLIISVGTTPVVAAPPDVSVQVEGTTLSDGGSVTINANPTISLDITADSKLNTVSVRIDGEPRRTFSPNSNTFSKEFTLDLEDGNHELTVVASTSETATHSGTVTKDSVGPRVRFTSPFTTSKLAKPDDTVTVNHGTVTLAGDLYDLSSVKRVTIERVYTSKFAGQRKTTRDTYEFNNPGSSFSQKLLLGPGANEMKLTVVDVHGQTRVHRWTLRVDDETKPQIRIQSVKRVADGPEVRIKGIVSDDTKVRSLWYTAGRTSSRKSILSETTDQPTGDRVSTEFTFTAAAGEGVESLTLTATDTSGNTRTREVSLNFEERVNPTISIDQQATAIENGQVHVVGAVAEGRVKRVTVETVNANGEVISLRTVYQGDGTTRVTIDERLDAASGETTVVIRAIDTLDRQHERSLKVTASTGQRASGSENGATNASDATSTSMPTTTTTPGADANPTESSSPGFGVVLGVLGILLMGFCGARGSP